MMSLSHVRRVEGLNEEGCHFYMCTDPNSFTDISKNAGSRGVGCNRNLERMKISSLGEFGVPLHGEMETFIM